MEVTLAKALVIKNRLVTDLVKIRSKIKGANHLTLQSLEEKVITPKFTHDIQALLKEEAEIRAKLIGTKVAISVANKDRDQQTRIFVLGELKSEIVALEALTCKENKSIESGYKGGSTITYTFVQINEDQREKMIKDLREKIDQYQEEMEKFNWVTKIEVP